MSRPLAIAVPAAVLTLTLGVTLPPPSHAMPDEPALRLEIDLGGTKFEGEAGRELEVNINGKPVKLTVQIKPHRRFDAAGVRFDYPRGMSYAFESENGLDMWTLDGDAAQIMVQQLDEDSGPELATIILDEILADQEAEAPKRIQLQLGKTKVTALRSHITGEDYFESWTVCGLDVGGRPVILLLQDLPDVAGEITDEMRGLLDLLAKTFERD